MKIVIFGGTTEGRKLAQELASYDDIEVALSVTSDYGEEQIVDMTGRIGISKSKKTPDEMVDYVRGAEICVDATHPYAVEASDNIRKATRTEGVELVRLVRDKADEKIENNIKESNHKIIYVNNANEAAEIAKEFDSKVILTTGSKDLPIYAKALDMENIYPRVLPSGESIKACTDVGIPHKNIIALHGPFSKNLNIALIDEFDIEVLVTKESGKAGGYEEKIEACREKDIQAIVIRRPKEEGSTYEEVMKLCKEKIDQM